MLMVVCGVDPRKRDPVDPLRGRCGAVRGRLQVSGPDQILHAAGELVRVAVHTETVLAAATASTLRLAEVSPSCSLIAFSSCMVLSPTTLLPSGYWTPPGYMLSAGASSCGTGGVCVLLRIPVPRTPVNKGKRRGRGNDTPAQ
jgi:hypothetical protein